jgi:hypothetical protein
MPTVFFMSRLKDGVRKEDYEKWLVSFDYEKAKQVHSILSYRTYRISGRYESGKKPYDYLEVVEITDLEEYRQEGEDNPAMQAIAREWANFLEVADSLHGAFIPPGVLKSKV